MAKKRNPQDVTLRNLRAMKKRVDALQRRVAKLEAWRGWKGGRAR